MSDLNLIKPKSVQNIINKFCYTIGMLPTSYKISLTYEEQILAIGQYLEETVIPALNNNAEAVAELQTLFVQLKDYVENYFDNLDVQNEINNKLDQMAEDGTLQEIITSYLNVNGILAFNTLNNMKNATNLINGSFAKTYGLNEYNDGNGEFYKIRNILNTDVIDNINIVALNNFNTLIAEKIKNNEIDNLKMDVELIKNKRIIFMGDSYSTAYTPVGNIKGWPQIIKENWNLNDNDFLFLGANGLGFCKEDDTGQHTKAIDRLRNSNMSNPYTVTDIVVCMGANDYQATYEEIEQAIKEFCTLAKEKYPNAIVKIGMIGNNWDVVFYNNLVSTVLPAYKTASNNINGVYLTNTEYILHNHNFMSSDTGHPNSEGQKALANYISNAIINGSCDVNYVLTLPITFSDNTNGTIKVQVNNDITSFTFPTKFFNNQNLQGIIGMSGDISFILGQYRQWIIHDYNRIFAIPCIIRTTSRWYNAYFNAKLFTDAVKGNFTALSNDNQGFLKENITEIGLGSFTISTNTL